MDWNQIGTEVIISLIGLAITIIGGVITYIVNKKIKDERIRNILNQGLSVVKDGVGYVYQTYVESIKGTGRWDEVTQKVAQDKALNYIINNTSLEMKKYLQKNGKDLSTWALEQIEVAIKNSKDTNKNKED